MLFRVVKCFKCNFYQVDSVKKAKKWQCKMCGENQSLQQEFATGSGKDCRLQVQRLNKQSADMNAEKHKFASKVLSGEIQVPELEKGAPEPSFNVGSRLWLDCVDVEDAGEEKGSIFKDFQSARESFSSRRVEDNSGKQDLPSWRDFYGNKRESARDKQEFRENSSSFFSHQYFDYEKKSSPLPKLMDYTQMNRSREIKKPFKEDTRTEENAKSLEPPIKKFKPDPGSGNRNVQEISSSSKWDNFCPSDEEL